MSFVVFDIETTGLSSTSNDIIQFAYIMFDDANNFVKAENLYYYYEGMSWSQEVADKTHGFSLGFLKQHENEFKANILKMYSVLNRANVCGFNSNHFDCPFVKNWLSRFGLSDFEFGIKQDVMLGLRPIHKQARIKLVKLKDMMGYNDETVASVANLWFDVSTEQVAHNAMFDSAATALMALEGLRKKYLTFDFSLSSKMQVEEDAFAYAEETNPAIVVDTVPVVKFAFFVSDGVADYLNIEPTTNSFSWTSTPDVNAFPVLPTGLFTKKTENLYVTEYRGCKVSLGIGDDVYIKIESPYITICSKESDVKPFLENL